VPGALKTLQEAEFGDYKPETMKSFEVGYKGLFNNKFLVDMYAYFGRYENFLGRQIVVQSLSASPTAPFLGPNRVLSIAVNSKDNVRTYGYGVSFDWLLGHNYVLTANASMDRIKDVPVGFVSFFNTPTYRVNVGFSNTGMGYQKRIGFAAMMRNQDGFFYESDFRQGSIPGYTVIDAQVSYKFPKIRSLIKLGANNLTNKYYRTAFGNPGIGGLYYVSYGYNVF
jgi:outer membrane receptor protein involved in Fe transport